MAEDEVESRATKPKPAVKPSTKKYVTSVHMTDKSGKVTAEPGDTVSLTDSQAKSLGSRVQEA